MRKNWMAELAAHYEKTHRRYPNDRLLLLLDIDGTILDARYMVWRLLQVYDRNHRTQFFQDLNITDIGVHEDHITPLLDKLRIPLAQQAHILSWYRQQAWSAAAVLEAHRPFRGVLEVIRWFQMQPNTYVGLNTARPESLRAETLRSLNRLGQEYKVYFADELLYLRPDAWSKSAPEAKAAGVRRFQQAGFRVFAFVDNEPENLRAVAEIDPAREILLLHADTVRLSAHAEAIFQSTRTQLPPHTVGGDAYDLTALISEKDLPRHIQFVWYNINDAHSLSQFLASDVRWGQLDVRPTPTEVDLFVNLKTLTKNLSPSDETFVSLSRTMWHSLSRALSALQVGRKGIKLDLSANAELLDQVLKFIQAFQLDDGHVWFSGSLRGLQEQGLRKLAAAYPRAIIECPVDFMAPLICSAPLKAREVLSMFQGWGVNRFSISWQTPDLRPFFEQMDAWGFELNIYDVPDLESFLQAVLLMPRSITASFDWRYVGRTSRENGRQSPIVPLTSGMRLR